MDAFIFGSVDRVMNGWMNDGLMYGWMYRSADGYKSE